MTSDLSAGGVSLSTTKFLPQDSRVLLLLSLPDLPSPMRIISRVAWLRPDPGEESYNYGLQFTVIASSDQDALAGYIERGVVRPIIYS